MSHSRRSLIALDFGDHAVKAVQLERSGKHLRLRAAREATVAPGPVESRRQRLVDAAGRALTSAPFRGRGAAVALRLTDVTVRHVRIARDDAEHAGEHLAREVREQLPGAGEHSLCAIPVAELLDHGQQLSEFLCCLAGAEAVGELIAITEALGLVPEAIELETSAQARPFQSAQSNASFLLLDIGSATTRITIVRSGVPVLMRMVRIGSEDLLTALDRHLHLDLDSLLDLGRAVDDAGLEVQHAVVGALAEPLDRILGRVADCVRYCGSLFQGRAVTKVRVAGGLAGLPGLVAHLGRRIGITCELADPFAALGLPAPPHRAGLGSATWATAVGLAIREVSR
ncbi:MAG: pilus assembly protein PilM [Planctomycetes bacterium]|nr:pilus assembly protein PilM [Planctomycetota bacterium]